MTENIFGIGLRHQHHKFVLQNRPRVGFFEVHSENFIAKGGSSIDFLEKISEIYKISFHCVGLSLGSGSGLDKKHLIEIKNLCDKFKPFLLSDHLSWSSSEKGVSNDLLPVPYNKKMLEVFCNNIKEAQNFFGREILIENPSAYLEFKENEFSEVDFLNEIALKTQCKILLDINNVFVSSINFGLDAINYLKNIDASKVAEIHLAGHSISKIDGQEIRIDTHSTKVCDEVLNLYKNFIKTHKNIPTLIEWDEDIPEFKVLENEMKKITKIYERN